MANTDIVEGIYEAFGRGDTESVIEALHPEIEWVEPEIEGFPYGGTRRGLQTVIEEVLAVIPQTWEQVELQPNEWVADGDTVVVLGQYSARAKGGQEGSWRFAHVWKLRDGKAVRVESFFDTLAQLRTLGGAR